MRLAARPSPRSTRRAFTMIELIVVMAIIVILLGIVVVGFKHVSASGQKRQTQTLLERLKNVTTNTYANKATATRFFQQQVPAVYSNGVPVLTGGTTPYGNAQPWDAVPAAANESLFKTGLILKAILADPEAKRIFDDLPTERKKEFYFRNTDGQLVGAPLATGTTTFTLPLDAWGGPILFVFDNWRTATSPSADAPHLSASNTFAGVPAPTGGLTELYSASSKTYWQFAARPTVTDPAYATQYVVPTTTPPYTQVRDAANNVVPAFRSPDERPFWASAGPDGNFATHDDNVYSFEN